MDRDTGVLEVAAWLSDTDLLARVEQLAAQERQATVALIAHLAELDARRLCLAAGYSSLFKYCTDVLHLSEHAAYNRIETARAVRRFPVLLEHLGAGWVTLFAARLLAPHLTPDNHREVLALARHKSRREIEELIARLQPRPPVPDVIRKLPVRAQAVNRTSVPDKVQDASGVPGGEGTPEITLAVEGSVAPAGALRPVPTARGFVVRPLAPARYKVHL